MFDDGECYVIEGEAGRVNFGYEEIKNFLEHAILPEDATSEQRRATRRRSIPYTMISDILYRAGRDGVLCRAVEHDEARLVLNKCHEGICGGHFVGDATAKKILMAGYHWPTLFKDSVEFCKTCPSCQAYGKRSFPHTELHPILPIGAFEKWGLDFMGPLPKTSKRNQYIIVATDYLTKWSEAWATKRNSEAVAVDFLYNQIVCRFGISLEVVTDQGSHFMGGVVTELLKKLSVKHRRTTPYYLQANGLVEKTNGILAGIIAKVILDKRQTWDEHLGEALWAYRTMYKLTTGFTPFQLTFGLEAVLPIEIQIPLLRLALQHDLDDAESLTKRLLSLEKLDKCHCRALRKNELIQAQCKLQHDKLKNLIEFEPSNLVMIVNSWLMKQHDQKFKPKWKGP